MEIKNGPIIQAYADRYNLTVDKVIEWVNGYVNSPVDHIPLMVRGAYEKTQAERAKAIRQYMQDEAK